MVLLEPRTQVKDYRSIATRLAEELIENAVDRDARSGLPTDEVSQLRQEGLLTINIPQAYGGAEVDLLTAMKVTQLLSHADGSIGQLYSNHLGLTTLAHVAGTAAQKEYYYRGTVHNQWFWGNSINMRDTRLKIAPEGEKFRLNGVKGFGTGVPVADQMVFSAIREDIDAVYLIVLPKHREGIVFNNDWDNIGQRRTASGSISFNQVLVEPEEILGYPDFPAHAFSTFLGIVAQLSKAYVYLGIAEGALTAAQNYTRTQTRSWITSGVDAATQDPYILHRYGELWAQLQAAIALADQTSIAAQSAWDKEINLTAEERGAVAVSVFATKVTATRVGLDITNRIFELMGSRSTATRFGFDRYWRDLRTFTLHDPIDYKFRDIGNWVLNNELPTVTQYS